MKEGRKERFTWTRPDDVIPGYTRAVGILQPVAVAHREDPAPVGVVLIPVARDADPNTFSLFMERPGGRPKRVAEQGRRQDHLRRAHPACRRCRDLLRGRG
jgi:hypothetical protein